MHTARITQTAATVAALMGFSMPDGTDGVNEAVMQAAEPYFGKTPAARALLYNPDAIAYWLYQAYADTFLPLVRRTHTALQVHSVMPSVTPVCFASMYTGLAPQDHGIMTYKKPVLRVPTLFDAAIAAGKKPIIISTKGDSISEIFKERDMAYIFCDTEDECNAHALEAIRADEHDLIVVYNGNYDSTMHRYGPEDGLSMQALRHNIDSFLTLQQEARTAWQGRPFLAAFLPDHGCHAIDGGCGSHGLDMPEDMEIIHAYAFLPPNPKSV